MNMKFLLKAAVVGAICVATLYFLAACMFGLVLTLFSFPAVCIPVVFAVCTGVVYKDLQWEEDLERLYG